MSTFPKNFLWGASTSSHQVEGNTYNDWSEWEKKHADRLAKEAEKKFSKLPSWPRIKEEAQMPENYISGIACDHYNRFREDFDIAKSLGHNAHRFSIEWSRIEPKEGKFNEKEIEHYAQVVQTLRERGLEPFVTLWHWTLPLWLRDKGGVGSKEFPRYFLRYAQKVIDTLYDIRFWTTLNEPEIYALNSYLTGAWPPQKKNLFTYYHITANLIRAHRAVYRTMKNARADRQIGIVVNMPWFESGSGPINALIKWGADKVWTYHILNHVHDETDFIGLNHYFHNRIAYGFNKNKNERVSDMGWELFPEAIYHVLRGLRKYQKPIYITENGLADMRDENRAWFIRETLMSVNRAIDDGADVRGYFHWSLMDNFEWDKGFWPRFGLVEINRKTLERTIRPSALIYKKIIEDAQQ